MESLEREIEKTVISLLSSIILNSIVAAATLLDEAFQETLGQDLSETLFVLNTLTYVVLIIGTLIAFIYGYFGKFEYFLGLIIGFLLAVSILAQIGKIEIDGTEIIGFTLLIPFFIESITWILGFYIREKSYYF